MLVASLVMGENEVALKLKAENWTCFLEGEMCKSRKGGREGGREGGTLVTVCGISFVLP